MSHVRWLEIIMFIFCDVVIIVFSSESKNYQVELGNSAKKSTLYRYRANEDLAQD